MKKQPKNGKSKKFSTKLSSWKGKFPKPKPKSDNSRERENIKVKNFQRNYLESEKFFSKFSYFLERENFG